MAEKKEKIIPGWYSDGKGDRVYKNELGQEVNFMRDYVFAQPWRNFIKPAFDFLSESAVPTTEAKVKQVEGSQALITDVAESVRDYKKSVDQKAEMKKDSYTISQEGLDIYGEYMSVYEFKQRQLRDKLKGRK